MLLQVLMSEILFVGLFVARVWLCFLNDSQ